MLSILPCRVSKLYFRVEQNMFWFSMCQQRLMRIINYETLNCVSIDFTSSETVKILEQEFVWINSKLFYLTELKIKIREKRFILHNAQQSTSFQTTESPEKEHERNEKPTPIRKTVKITIKEWKAWCRSQIWVRTHTITFAIHFTSLCKRWKNTLSCDSSVESVLIRA